MIKWPAKLPRFPIASLALVCLGASDSSLMIASGRARSILCTRQQDLVSKIFEFLAYGRSKSLLDRAAADMQSLDNHFLVTFPPLPSRTPRSAYSSSSRSPAASDKTARTSYPRRRAVRGTSSNPFPAAAASPSLHPRH